MAETTDGQGRIVDLGNATLQALAQALNGPVNQVYTAEAPGVEARLDRLYDAVNAAAVRTDPTANDDVTSAEAYTNAIIAMHQTLRGSVGNSTRAANGIDRANQTLRSIASSNQQILEFLKSGRLVVNIAGLNVSARNDITSAVQRATAASRAIGPVSREISPADAYARAARDNNRALAGAIGQQIGDGGGYGGRSGLGGRMGPGGAGRPSGWLKGAAGTFEKIGYALAFVSSKFNEVTKLSWKNALPDMSGTNDYTESIAALIYQTRGFLHENAALDDAWMRLNREADAAGVTMGEFRQRTYEFGQRGLDLATKQERAQIRELKRQGKMTQAAMLEHKLYDRRVKSHHKIVGASLSAAQQLHMEAGQTADLFNKWHMHLGMNSIRMQEMSRHMQAVSRTSGVTGDNLLSAMKSADALAKSLKSAGGFEIGTAKGITEQAVMYEKYGVGQVMQPLQQAMTGFKNFMEADQATRGMLTRQFARGGDAEFGRGGSRIALTELRQGRGMTAENQKIMMKGLELNVRDFLGQQQKIFDDMGLGIDARTMDLTRIDQDVMQQMGRMIKSAQIAQLDIEQGRRKEPLTPQEIAALQAQHTHEYLQQGFQNLFTMGAGDLSQLFKAQSEITKTPQDRIAELTRQMNEFKRLGQTGAATDKARQIEQLQIDQLMSGFATIQDATEAAGKNLSEMGGLKLQSLQDALKQQGLGGMTDPAMLQRRTSDLMTHLQSAAQRTGEDLSKILKSQGVEGGIDEIKNALRSGNADLIKWGMEELGQAQQEIFRESKEQQHPITRVRGDIREVHNTLTVWFEKIYQFFQDNLKGLAGILSIIEPIMGIAAAIAGFLGVRSLGRRLLGTAGAVGAGGGLMGTAATVTSAWGASRLNPRNWFRRSVPKTPTPHGTMKGAMGRAHTRTLKARGATGQRIANLNARRAAAGKTPLNFRGYRPTKGSIPARSITAPRPTTAPRIVQRAPKGGMLRKGGKFALFAFGADQLLNQGKVTESLTGWNPRGNTPQPQVDPGAVAQGMPSDDDCICVYVMNWPKDPLIAAYGGPGAPGGPPPPPQQPDVIYVDAPPMPESPVETAFMGMYGYSMLKNAREGMKMSKMAQQTRLATQSMQQVNAARQTAQQGKIAQGLKNMKDAVTKSKPVQAMTQKLATAKTAVTGLKDSRAVVGTMDKLKKTKDVITANRFVAGTADKLKKTKDAVGAMSTAVRNSKPVQALGTAKNWAGSPFRWMGEKLGALKTGAGGLASKLPGVARATTFLQGTSRTAGVLRGTGAVAKKLPLLDLALGGAFGYMDAERHGFNKAEGTTYGILTGGAGSGTEDKYFSGKVSDALGIKKGSNADELVGAYGSMGRGTMIGASVAGPVGAAVGAAVGGGAEIVKILHGANKEVDRSRKQQESFDKNNERVVNSIIDKFTKGVDDPAKRLKEIDRLIKSKENRLITDRKILRADQKERAGVTNWLGVNPHARQLNANIESDKRQLATTQKALRRLKAEKEAALQEKSIVDLQQAAKKALAGKRPDEITGSRKTLAEKTNQAIQAFNKKKEYESKMSKSKNISDMLKYQQLAMKSQIDMQKAMGEAKTAEKKITAEDAAKRKKEWDDKKKALAEQAKKGGLEGASAQNLLDTIKKMETKTKGSVWSGDYWKKLMEKNVEYVKANAQHSALVAKLHGESNKKQDEIKKALGTEAEKGRAEKIFGALTSKQALLGSGDNIKGMLMQTMQNIDKSGPGMKGKAMIDKLVQGGNVLDDPEALKLLSAQMKKDLQNMKNTMENYRDPQTKALLTLEEKAKYLEQAVGMRFGGMKVDEVERLIKTMDAKLVNEKGKIDATGALNMGLFENKQAREAQMEVANVKAKETAVPAGPEEALPAGAKEAQKQSETPVTLVSTSLKPKEPEVPDFPQLHPLEAIREYAKMLTVDVKGILNIMKGMPSGGANWDFVTTQFTNSFNNMTPEKRDEMLKAQMVAKARAELEMKQEADLAKAKKLNADKLAAVQKTSSEKLESLIKEKMKSSSLYKGLDFEGAKKQYEMFRSMSEKELRTLIPANMVKETLSDIKSTEEKRNESDQLIKSIEEDAKRLSKQNAATYLEKGAFDPVEVKNAKMAGVDDKVKMVVAPKSVEGGKVVSHPPEDKSKSAKKTVEVAQKAVAKIKDMKISAATPAIGKVPSPVGTYMPVTIPAKALEKQRQLGVGGVAKEKAVDALGKAPSIQETLNKLQQKIIDDSKKRAEQSKHPAIRMNLLKVVKERQKSQDMLKSQEWKYDKEKDLYFRGFEKGKKDSGNYEMRRQIIDGDALRSSMDRTLNLQKAKNNAVEMLEKGAFDKKSAITEAKMVGVDAVVTKALQDVKPEDATAIAESLPQIPDALQKGIQEMKPEFKTLAELILATNTCLEKTNEHLKIITNVLAHVPTATALALHASYVSNRSIRAFSHVGGGRTTQTAISPDEILRQAGAVQKDLLKAQGEKLKAEMPTEIKLEQKGALDPKEIKLAKQESIDSLVTQMKALGLSPDDAMGLLKKAGGDYATLKKVIESKTEEIKKKQDATETSRSLDYEKAASESVEQKIAKETQASEERSSSHQDVVRDLNQSFDDIVSHLTAGGAKLEKISKEGEKEKYKVSSDAFEVELSKDDITKAASKQFERSVETSLAKSLDYERAASEAAEKNVVSELTRATQEGAGKKTLTDEERRKSIVAELSRALDYEKQASEASEQNIVNQLNKATELAKSSSEESQKNIVASLSRTLDYEKAASDSATGIFAERDAFEVSTAPIDYSDTTKAMVEPLLVSRANIEERIEQQKYGDEPSGSGTALLPGMDSIDQYLTGTQAQRMQQMVALLTSIDQKLTSPTRSNVVGAKGGGSKPMPPAGVELTAMSRPNPSWQQDFIDGQAGEQTTEGSGSFG